MLATDSARSVATSSIAIAPITIVSPVFPYLGKASVKLFYTTWKYPRVILLRGKRTNVNKRCVTSIKSLHSANTCYKDV